MVKKIRVWQVKRFTRFKGLSSLRVGRSKGLVVKDGKSVIEKECKNEIVKH